MLQTTENAKHHLKMLTTGGLSRKHSYVWTVTIQYHHTTINNNY